jgi:hypothetical protein
VLVEVVTATPLCSGVVLFELDDDEDGDECARADSWAATSWLGPVGSSESGSSSSVS